MSANACTVMDWGMNNRRDWRWLFLAAELGSDRISLAAALKKSDRILPADPCSEAPPTQGNPRDPCNSETPSPVSPKELTQPGEELGRPTI